MKNKRNYYRLLHVQMDAPTSVINASYRAMMQKLKLHPDLGGDEWNASLLNEARDVLLDEARRSEHDRALAARGFPLFNQRKKPLQQTSAGGTPAPMDRPQPTSADRATAKDDGGSGAQETPVHEQADSASSSPVHDIVGQDTTPVCAFCGKPVIWESAAAQVYTARMSCTRCDSPLSPPISGDAIMADGMRRINRSYFEFVARIWKSWPLDDGFSALVCDWSTMGCGVELSESLVIGDIVLLRSPGFDAVAAVRHRRLEGDARNIYGLEYLTVEIRLESGALHSSAA